MGQGTRPWPVAVISAHLTAAPLLPGAARSDLAGADPVFARALAPNTLPSGSTAAPTSPPPWPASYSTPKTDLGAPDKTLHHSSSPEEETTNGLRGCVAIASDWP